MLKRYPAALYLVWVVFLALLPAPLVWVLDTGLVESTRNLLIYDAGVVAYTWWLTIVAVSTRPQWLDRLIGLPAMYFVHGMLGVLALVLATIHVQLSFTMHDIIRNTGKTAWYLAIFGVGYAALFLSGWFVDRWPLALHMKNRLQFFFKHQLSVWIHRLNLVVIALIWLHIHVIPRISNVTPFVLMIDGYTILALGIYLWAKFVAPAAPRRGGQVVENRVVDSRVRQLVIRLGDQARQYRPGDFYFLSFPHTTGISREAHPFSVTTAPNQERTVTFTIQTLGDFTSRLGSVVPGAAVNLEGPFGRFDTIIANDSPTVPLVLIGMGIGLAPLISLAQRYADNRPVHLLWTVRPGEEHIFAAQLTPLLRAHRKVRLDQHVHRFAAKDLAALITPEERTAGRFVVVGTAPGVVDIEKALSGLGVARHQMTDERLTM